MLGLEGWDPAGNGKTWSKESQGRGDGEGVGGLQAVKLDWGGIRF